MLSVALFGCKGAKHASNAGSKSNELETKLFTKHDIDDYVSREINGMLHNSDSNLILRVNYIEDYLAEQK